MNLLRAILIQAESGTPFTTLDGYPDDAVRYHIALAHEAGLLHALIQRQPPTPVLLSAQAFDLTWAGHEFVSVARDDTNWNNVVTHVAKPAVAWSFGIVKDVLADAAKATLTAAATHLLR